MLNRFRQYLTNKGLRYEVHEPNVITFDYSSHTYMFEYTHPNYIRLMLPSFENCNSFDAAKWVTISELNATYKVAKIVKSGKFSYISKFHIIISCKLIVYIVMCFYQETN